MKANSSRYVNKSHKLKKIHSLCVYSVFPLQDRKKLSYRTRSRVNQGDIVRLIAPGGRGASELPPMLSYIESLGNIILVVN